MTPNWDDVYWLQRPIRPLSFDWLGSLVPQYNKLHPHIGSKFESASDEKGDAATRCYLRGTQKFRQNTCARANAWGEVLREMNTNDT